MHNDTGQGCWAAREREVDGRSTAAEDDATSKNSSHQKNRKHLKAADKGSR